MSSEIVKFLLGQRGTDFSGRISRRQLLGIGAVAAGGVVLGGCAPQQPTEGGGPTWVDPAPTPTQTAIPRPTATDIPMPILSRTTFDELMGMDIELAEQPAWLAQDVQIAGFMESGQAKDFDALLRDVVKLVPETVKSNVKAKTISGKLEIFSNLPKDFQHDVVIDNFALPRSHVWTAYQLYKNAIPGLKAELAPFALSTQLTESNLWGTYISTGGSCRFNNINPRVANYATEKRNLATLASAGWVGADNLIAAAKQNLQIRNWTINNYMELPCSNETAMGQKQFLPSTWVGEVINREAIWSKTQITEFLNNLKKLGIIRPEVNSLRQLNPYIYTDAFVMAMLYMDTKNISVSGANFTTSWNADKAQANTVVGRYGTIKAGLDRVYARYGKGDKKPNLVQEAKEISTSGPFGPFYQGTYKQRHTIPATKYNIHGFTDYNQRPNQYDRLWWGVDSIGISSKNIISPVNGRVIKTAKEDEHGFYMDIETTVPANDGRQLKCIVRIHHTEDRRRVVGSVIKKGDLITYESKDKAHTHAGCIIQDPDKKDDWLFVPINVLMDAKYGPKEYYDEDYYDGEKGAILPDSYINGVIAKLIKYGIVRTTATQENKEPASWEDLKKKYGLVDQVRLVGTSGYLSQQEDDLASPTGIMWHTNDQPADTALADRDGIGLVQWFVDNYSSVRPPYHFVIGSDGKIYQICPLNKRALHAGDLKADGTAGYNYSDIAIACLTQKDADTPTKIQLSAIRDLSRVIMKTYGIEACSVQAHKEILNVKVDFKNIDMEKERKSLGCK